MKWMHACIIPLWAYSTLASAAAAPAPKKPPPGPSGKKGSGPPSPLPATEPIWFGQAVTVNLDSGRPYAYLKFGARAKAPVKITTHRDDPGPLGLKLYRVVGAGAKHTWKLLAEAGSTAPTDDVIATTLKERGDYVIEAVAGGGDPSRGATAVTISLGCQGKGDRPCALAAQPGDACGPKEACDAGLLCKPSQGCKGAGSCVVQPRECPRGLACRPACGCDGKTYCGECDAEHAGTFIDKPGECTGRPCTATSLCGAGDYCAFAPGACNGKEPRGTCKPRPEVCMEIYKPVCGCDGKTYSNQCAAAAAAGVSVAADGACTAVPGACQTAADCKGVLPRVCEVCKDGKSQCAHFICRGGRCITEVCPM